MVINNPGESAQSNIIRKCITSAKNNITVMLIIGDSLPDLPVRDCPKLSKQTSKAQGQLSTIFSQFLSLAPCVLPYGTVHGWLNNSSSYTQDLKSVKTQPIDAFPENAPRGLDHTANFKTRFYLFAPPIKLKTLMSPSPANLDSLAWKLGWTCNSPPLKQPSVWHLTPEHSTSRNLNFALLPPRPNRDPLNHLPVYRPWQSALPPNKTNNLSKLPPMDSPEYPSANAMHDLAYPNGKPNKTPLPIGTIPTALAEYLRIIAGISTINMTTILTAIATTDAYAHQFLNQTKIASISNFRSNLGILSPSPSTGAFPPVDLCSHCTKATPTRWFIGPTNDPEDPSQHPSSNNATLNTSTTHRNDSILPEEN
mmetsp:Transcript_71466/g.163785  ORF Transcript_71466/g.163785 Transcript_71466/m.163785 type:complete len:367 (+) Transcript_71466:3761-4861(+)